MNKRIFTLFFVLLVSLMSVRAAEGSYSVWLESVGNQKIAVIKLLKEELGITLSEAQALVNAAPCYLTEGRTQEEAQDLVDKLANLGATTEVHVDINATNFPDDNFRTFVKENCQTDGDDHLSNAEIAAVTNLEPWANIADLTGIGYFTELKFLDCSHANLTSLDVSKNTKLKTLFCNSNQLTSLDVSKNTELTTLDCNSNQLISLDVSKNTKLKTLYCNSNQLTSLDVSKNTELTTLSCVTNQLTSLNVSKNTKLTTLYCNSNQLTSLDVSKNTKLEILNCSVNELTELNVTKNIALEMLYCYHNQLTSLDVSKNTALWDIACENNQINEAAMGMFVESLPTVEPEKDLFVFKEGSDSEGNVMNSEQVAAAKAKGWYAKYVPAGGNDWIDYPGSVPSGIEDVNGETISDNRYYSIDGKRIDGVPTKNGIYIVNGRKVVVRLY